MCSDIENQTFVPNVAVSYRDFYKIILLFTLRMNDKLVPSASCLRVCEGRPSDTHGDKKRWGRVWMNEVSLRRRRGTSRPTAWGPLSILLYLFYLILSTYDTEKLANIILLCVHKVYLLSLRSFPFVKR